MADDRPALAFLVLLASTPFLQPIHRLPVTSFYEEWLAILLALGLATATLLARGIVALPSSAVAPLFLGLVAIGQWAAGWSGRGEFVAAYAVYLGAAALLASVAATLATRHGRPGFFRTLAAGVLAGGLISVGLAMLQRLQVPLPMEIMFPARGRPVANVAQPNELTSYLWLGLLACAYLWQGGALRRGAAFAFAALLGIGIGLAGSRMGLLQAGALALLLGFLWWSGSDLQRRRGQAGLLLACIFGAVVATPAFDRIAPPHRGVLPSALDRLAQVGVFHDARADLWRDTAVLIAERPLAGNGIGNYPWRMVEAAARAPSGADTYPGAEHAHNAFLQLAADFGLPVTMLLVAALVAWLVRVMRAEAGRPEGMAERDFGLGILLVLGIHSLLEYPLWHMECLALFFLAAGALDPATMRPPRGPHRRLSAVVAAAMAATLLSVFLDYRTIDRAANRPLDATDAAWQQRVDGVVALAKTSLMRPYAYVGLATLLVPEAGRARDQSLICEQAMRVWPDPLIITKCAVLRCMTGQPEQSRQILGTLHHAFRDDERRRVIRNGIEVFAKKNPGVANPGVCGFS